MSASSARFFPESKTATKKENIFLKKERMNKRNQEMNKCTLKMKEKKKNRTLSYERCPCWQKLKRSALLCSSCLNKNTVNWEATTIEIYFLTVLDPRKYKMKVPALSSWLTHGCLLRERERSCVCERERKKWSEQRVGGSLTFLPLS